MVKRPREEYQTALLTTPLTLRRNPSRTQTHCKDPYFLPLEPNASETSVDTPRVILTEGIKSKRRLRFRPSAPVFRRQRRGRKRVNQVEHMGANLGRARDLYIVSEMARTCRAGQLELKG
ncbi:unnamed protein product [Linum trigynum]|uniref:Uncharacterized protein n=1 Tax=Linum trigynum TaxID=586398 RepID=A0AAV2F8W4_9ROSI